MFKFKSGDGTKNLFINYQPNMGVHTLWGNTNSKSGDVKVRLYGLDT